MNVRIETLETATVAVPEGRVDFNSATEFQTQLEAALAGVRGPGALIVDCSGLEYVSSAGLRAFLLCARGAQRASVPFALCALQPAVREVFELSGFSRIIAIHPDRGTALAQCRPPRA
jgi:anti-anti-sigma factor